MPSAAPSFLLLRFLCRHKENEGAGGTPPVLLYAFRLLTSGKKAQQINNLLVSLLMLLYYDPTFEPLVTVDRWITP